MTEPQPQPRVHYQPPRERLALLLDQLSEFDPDADRRPKLEPYQDKKPESKLRFEAAPAKKLKLEPVPIRKAEPAAVAEAVVEKKSEPKPAKKVVTKRAAKPPAQKIVARKAAVKAKPKSQAKTNSNVKAEPTSFHAVLRNCAKKQVRLSPQSQARQFQSEPILSPWVALTQRGLLGSLMRGWSWLNSKYKTSASKRLRLSEVVQLGDKRFVALVKVEDREFLIGGAASGLSLLSPLEAAAGTIEMRKRGSGSGGKAR